jgi:hypoxanthine phosphoribosyltransferase
MDKLFLSYNQIHQTVKNISEQIIKDNFDFDHMIAIGTGGFIPSRMLKTFINRPIITVGMAYYDLNDNKRDKPVITQWLDDPDTQVTGRRILLVDEVDDTRSTIGFCLEKLFKHNPAEIAVAVLHDKNKPKSREIPPQVKRYYRGLKIEDRWICYPWDALDIWEQDKQAVWTDS